MSKWRFILWLILTFVLSSCDKDVWYENTEKEFASLGIILSILIKATAIILLGYFLLKKCIIPYFASTRSRSHHLWHWVENHLTGLFYTAWGFGFITYFVGSYVGNTTWAGFMSMLSSVPMSAVYATGMFIGQSDISAVYDQMHNNPIYMAMFGLSHLFAVLISLCFVFKHIGYHIIAKYRLEIELGLQRRYKNIYVFWGVNDASIKLAKSTIEHDSKNGREKGLVVFVKTPLEEDTEEEKALQFGRFLNFVSIKDKEQRKLEELENCIIISTFHKLSQLELDDSSSGEDVLGEYLKLPSLANIIERLADTPDTGSNNGVHFFFLGEDRDANINATLNLIKDIHIRRHQAHIYCQARHRARTAWMDHYYLLHPEEKTYIHVIDTAILSVMHLKGSIEHHPAKYVKWENKGEQHKGIPSSRFSSLVIGFNETGVEGLMFLYEFATFVDENACRIPGTFVAIDRDVTSLSGGFYAKAPALQYDKEIRFVGCSIDDEHYWKELKALSSTLNYVIVSAGDDNMGINTAVNICQMIHKDIHRDHTNKLTVFVRSYDMDNYYRIRKVADDVNRLYAEENISIEIFGHVDQLFTYDMIVNDRIIQEAKRYNHMYSETTGSTEEVWKYELGIKANPNEYTIKDIEEIGRKQEQNICNSLHKATKNYILHKYNEFDNPSDLLRTRLAQLEHERWVAYSKLHGWQIMPHAQRNGKTKDIVHKLHTDICHWNHIREWSKDDQMKTRFYDYKVVDVSIRLEKENVAVEQKHNP